MKSVKKSKKGVRKSRKVSKSVEEPKVDQVKFKVVMLMDNGDIETKSFTNVAELLSFVSALNVGVEIPSKWLTVIFPPGDSLLNKIRRKLWLL